MRLACLLPLAAAQRPQPQAAGGDWGVADGVVIAFGPESRGESRRWGLRTCGWSLA